MTCRPLTHPLVPALHVPNRYSAGLFARVISISQSALLCANITAITARWLPAYGVAGWLASSSVTVVALLVRHLVERITI